MDPKAVRDLLERVRRDEVPIDDALEELRRLPFQALEFATLDRHRQLRTGFPEVILGEGKSAEQIATLLTELARDGASCLATRVAPDKATAALARLAPELGARYEAIARALVIERPAADLGRGTIAVVCAGTSDLPVAEEAILTARLMGNRVERIVDVGVAGLHRLLAQHARLREAEIIIAIAGMEGALPSVLAGLVGRPVIAVPTSVGYGASFGGLAALLGMLNACASGVVVVNIDNGFGAAYAASLLNRRRERG